MKKLSIIFIVVFITLFIGKINAQELANYQLYLQNGYLYNPSFIIAEQNYTAYLNTHLQWVGFNGAPRINSAGFYGPFNERNGFGVNLVTKKHGAMNTQQALLSYAYKANFSKNHYFLLGLSVGVKNDKIDYSSIVGNVDLSDPSIVSNYYNKLFVAAALGVSYYYKNFEAQLAIPQILARDAAKFYTMGIFAYNYKIDGDVWNLKPSVILSGTPISPYLIEGNFTTDWNKTFWVQMGYLSTNALTLGVGFNIKNYQLGYSYRDDYSVMGMASKGSHEIQLIAHFGKHLIKKPMDVLDEPLIAKYTGTVVNSIDNTPVRAKVIFYDESGSIIYQTKTDVQGKYLATINIDDTYKVEVSAPNFRTFETDVLASITHIDIRIKPIATVLKGKCNAPNASIAIHDENNTPIKTATADSVDNYTILLEPDATYKLDVTAEGYAAAQLDFKMPSDKMENVMDLNLKAIVHVAGNVRYKYSNATVSALVKFTDTTGNVVQQMEVNRSFDFQLVEGEYIIEISAENIITLKQQIIFAKEYGTDYFLDMVVNQLTEEKTFSLGTVNFSPGKGLILEDSYPILDDLVEIMMDNPEIKIEIGGHTDDSGDAATNLILSEQRAHDCKEYVVGKGIEENRLTAVGYGETKPLLPNTTPENKAKNRRVEFKILK